MRRGVARSNDLWEEGLDQLYQADLHVHTRYSGPVKHLRFFRARDCYSQPLDVYRRAKRRGMDLVTITDHDSIDGCLELLNKLGDLPDFVMGEEVSAYLPRFRHTVHIGVYGHNEAQHRDIQRLRSNGEELVDYLRRNDLLFVLNHFLHDFSNAARFHEFIERMAQLFDVFEVRNGTLQREHNTFIVALLERYRDRARPLGFVAGSDSHTMRTRSGRFSGVAGTVRPSRRSQPRTELMSSVRERVSASRAVQMDLRRRASCDGM